MWVVVQLTPMSHCTSYKLQPCELEDARHEFGGRLDLHRNVQMIVQIEFNHVNAEYFYLWNPLS